MKKVISETQLLNIIKESIFEMINETYNGPLYTTLTLAELLTAVKNDKMVADNTGADSSIVLTRNKVIKYSFDSAIVDDTAIICVLKFSGEKLANLRNNRIKPMSPNMDGDWGSKAKQSGLNLAFEKLSVKEIAPLSQYVDSIMIDLSKTEGDDEPIKSTYYDLDAATKNEVKRFAKKNGIKTKDAVLKYIISILKNNPKFGSKIAVTGGNMLTKNIFGHNDFVDDEPEVQPAINESKLKQFIKESVRKAFNESIYGNDYFTSTTTMDDVNDGEDNEEVDNFELEKRIANRIEWILYKRPRLGREVEDGDEFFANIAYKAFRQPLLNGEEIKSIFISDGKLISGKGAYGEILSIKTPKHFYHFNQIPIEVQEKIAKILKA